MHLDEMGVSSASRRQNKKVLGWPAIVYNASVHLILCGFFAYITCLSFIDVQEGKLLFSWHPPLMALASIIMTEAMLCFSSENIPTHNLDLKEKIFLHWTLHLAATCCFIAGFIIVAVHKINLGKYHFQTNHGIYGLIALIGFGMVMSGGLMANYSFQLRHYIRPVHTKILHTAFALINYLIVTMTVILGFYSSWFGKHGTTTSFYVCFVLIIFVTQYVIYKPVLTLGARLKGVWMRAYEL